MNSQIIEKLGKLHVGEQNGYGSIDETSISTRKLSGCPRIRVMYPLLWYILEDEFLDEMVGYFCKMEEFVDNPKITVRRKSRRDVYA